MEESDLHLGIIPGDIIRKIIPIIQKESLISARLISPSWNNMVQGTYGEKIDTLRFSFSYRRVGVEKISILRSLKFAEYNNTNFWVVRNEDMKGDLGQKMVRKMHTYCTVAVVEIRVKEIFDNTLDPVRSYLENLEVHTLKIMDLIRFDMRAKKPLLDILTSCKVQHFEITMSSMGPASFALFLTELMHDYRESVQSAKIFMEGPEFRHLIFDALDGNFWEKWVQMNIEQRPFVAQYFPNEDPDAYSNLKILVNRKQTTNVRSNTT